MATTIIIEETGASLTFDSVQGIQFGPTNLVTEHPIEEVGAKLRGMMPWIEAGKIVDKTKN